MQQRWNWQHLSKVDFTIFKRVIFLTWNAAWLQAWLQCEQFCSQCTVFWTGWKNCTLHFSTENALQKTALLLLLSLQRKNDVRKKGHLRCNYQGYWVLRHLHGLLIPGEWENNQSWSKKKKFCTWGRPAWTAGTWSCSWGVPCPQSNPAASPQPQLNQPIVKDVKNKQTKNSFHI